LNGIHWQALLASDVRCQVAPGTQWLEMIAPAGFDLFTVVQAVHRFTDHAQFQVDTVGFGTSSRGSGD
jgi:hypothetical protein